MWVMVLGDMIIFAGYFVVFMIYRSMHAREFLTAQQHLDVNIGVINTVILLTSSWFVVLAVSSTRAGRQPSGWSAPAWAACCSSCSRFYEWVAKIQAGHGNSEMFYSFYYVVTGVHLIHVLIGLIVGTVIRELRNPGRRRATVVESGVYWHMVDLLW
jgi:nitric oxide reductase NorE protein